MALGHWRERSSTLVFVFVSVIFVNSVEKMYAHIIDVYVRILDDAGGGNDDAQRSVGPIHILLYL